ncbi:MAG: hypothetical protein DHS20C12_13530 [Pseudohongiella sp.]|nr:MAG: hypothetical protein DHS20C12_13530 [Pseudohongiella sp.]
MSMNSHLESVNESYFQHMRHALSFTLDMLVGAICCLVHAFFPSLFEHTGSQLITKLHDRMVVNRAKLSSPDYEEQDGGTAQAEPN